MVIRSQVEASGAKNAVEGEFLPEGWSRADARARTEVAEWARLNPGVRGARRNADVVRVDRPKGYQSHGWKKERGPGGVEVWPEEQYTYSPDGRFEARSKSYRGAPTGRIYKEYLYKGTYFIKMIDYITPTMTETWWNLPIGDQDPDALSD